MNAFRQLFFVNSCILQKQVLANIAKMIIGKTIMEEFDAHTTPRKRGLPKGRSNNPGGRPKGSKNKIPAELKSRMVEELTNSFDKFFSRLSNLDDRDYIRAYTELLKLVIPQDKGTAQTDAGSDALANRLFHPGTQQEE